MSPLVSAARAIVQSRRVKDDALTEDLYQSVLGALKQAVADERERCAKVCDELAEGWLESAPRSLRNAARRIREGGDK